MSIAQWIEPLFLDRYPFEYIEQNTQRTPRDLIKYYFPLSLLLLLLI